VVVTRAMISSAYALSCFSFMVQHFILQDFSLLFLLEIVCFSEHSEDVCAVFYSLVSLDV